MLFDGFKIMLFFTKIRPVLFEKSGSHGNVVKGLIQWAFWQLCKGKVWNVIDKQWLFSYISWELIHLTEYSELH